MEAKGLELVESMWMGAVSTTRIGRRQIPRRRSSFGPRANAAASRRNVLARRLLKADDQILMPKTTTQTVTVVILVALDSLSVAMGAILKVSISMQLAMSMSLKILMRRLRSHPVAQLRGMRQKKSMTITRITRLTSETIIIVSVLRVRRLGRSPLRSGNLVEVGRLVDQDRVHAGHDLWRSLN